MATRRTRDAIKKAIQKRLDQEETPVRQVQTANIESPYYSLETFNQAAQNIGKSMDGLVAALKAIPIYNPVITTSSTTMTSGGLYTVGTSSTSNSLLIGNSIGAGSVTLVLNTRMTLVPESLVWKTPDVFSQILELKSDPDPKETNLIKTKYPEKPMQYWFVGRIKNMLVNYFVDVTIFDDLAGMVKMFVTHQKTIYLLEDCDGLFYGFV